MRQSVIGGIKKVYADKNSEIINRYSKDRGEPWYEDFGDNFKQLAYEFFSSGNRIWDMTIEDGIGIKMVQSSLGTMNPEFRECFERLVSKSFPEDAERDIMESKGLPVVKGSWIVVGKIYPELSELRAGGYDKYLLDNRAEAIRVGIVLVYGADIDTIELRSSHSEITGSSTFLKTSERSTKPTFLCLPMSLMRSSSIYALTKSGRTSCERPNSQRIVVFNLSYHHSTQPLNMEHLVGHVRMPGATPKVAVKTHLFLDASSKERRITKWDKSAQKLVLGPKNVAAPHLPTDADVEDEAIVVPQSQLSTVETVDTYEDDETVAKIPVITSVDVADDYYD